jgi:hypothetical protein
MCVSKRLPDKTGTLWYTTVCTGCTPRKCASFAQTQGQRSGTASDMFHLYREGLGYGLVPLTSLGRKENELKWNLAVK